MSIDTCFSWWKIFDSILYGKTYVACVECLWNNTFFIWSQFHSISSFSTVSFCFQGNHISKVWYHCGGWNTLEAFEVKNTHKFSTAGFFNKQRESDLTICIQIGPSFLQYQLLKTHFCLAVGFFEGVKNPVIYIIDGDISIPTTESTVILLWYRSQRGFGFFWSLTFDFFFSFWEHSIHYICLLVIFVSASVWACELVYVQKDTQNPYFLAAQ